jgi:hypothetical protein
MRSQHPLAVRLEKRLLLLGLGLARFAVLLLPGLGLDPSLLEIRRAERVVNLYSLRLDFDLRLLIELCGRRGRRHAFLLENARAFWSCGLLASSRAGTAVLRG